MAAPSVMDSAAIFLSFVETIPRLVAWQRVYRSPWHRKALLRLWGSVAAWTPLLPRLQSSSGRFFSPVASACKKSPRAVAVIIFRFAVCLRWVFLLRPYSVNLFTRVFWFEGVGLAPYPAAVWVYDYERLLLRAAPSAHLPWCCASQKQNSLVGGVHQRERIVAAPCGPVENLLIYPLHYFHTCYFLYKSTNFQEINQKTPPQ